MLSPQTARLCCSADDIHGEAQGAGHIADHDPRELITALLPTLGLLPGEAMGSVWQMPVVVAELIYVDYALLFIFSQYGRQHILHVVSVVGAAAGFSADLLGNYLKLLFDSVHVASGHFDINFHLAS